MARVRPFAAWRYASTGDLSSLTAPPYDVLSPEQRDELLRTNPHNVVALELPDGPLDPQVPGNRYETGRTVWDEWRQDGTLVRDAQPMLYVLEQRYSLNEREVSRKAFIVELGLEPFDAGIVLPHERTLPKALGDRFELIKATDANFSQVFALYEDPEQTTERIFSAIMGTDPLVTATDADGVLSTLWASPAEQVAADLSDLLSDSRIYIADGHHRYTTALAHRDERRAAAGDGAPADPDYDFVMVALVNMDDPDLVVLPTHRVADAAGDFDAAGFVAAMEQHFDLSELAPGHPSGALEGHDRPAYLVKTSADERPLLAVLRDDVDLDTAIAVDRSTAWKHLDVAVLQELVLDPLLGIHPDRPETLERLSFVKDAHEALRAIPGHDVAFVMRPTGLDQLRAVALAGEIMPQKSTYFYPKLLSGLLFRSMDD